MKKHRVLGINKKGFYNLQIFLAEHGETKAAKDLSDNNENAMDYFQTMAFRDAYIDDDGKLQDCTIEVGTWSTGMYSYIFDISELDIEWNAYEKK